MAVDESLCVSVLAIALLLAVDAAIAAVTRSGQHAAGELRGPRPHALARQIIAVLSACRLSFGLYHQCVTI